ncbi:TonB-dependent receptor [Sphingomonas sp. ID1715]|uniref:TonB-dependent receptor domain-containing protein n=1 Tax=Sphingomonas sp. ID1715 TaxID=1656898 RepID=UPI001487C961|nr:TonB-dependent receptor [Sphingomonas sp. ID1715]NNM77721.1 TonB-dependent receptor [Sphingomonas sp. ID1715]
MACLIASAADAADIRAFAIPAGPLGGALARFGEQAGMTIGVSDPSLAARRSAGVRGRMSAQAALQRLLRGTGAQAVFVDAVTVRIIRSAGSRRPSPVRSAAPQPRPSALVVGPQQDIIVTASKQGTPLDRYAGSVSVLALDPGKNAREASSGTAAVVARLPMVASTSLGPGRDKLFVRGIADSSFNGPSQATVGQYLGDVRLTYNAPDPDLNLYDIGRVEVLEGPQGTLYGTGSLGGIIRLVPNAPLMGRADGSASAGLVATHKGGEGGDAAAMLNLPLIGDRVAIRGVGYWSLDPGYIDDPSRGLSDINETRSYGGRAAIRYEPGAGWSLTLGGVIQNISSRDGQYVLRGSPPLTRSSAIAQPFDNDFRLGYLTIQRDGSAVSLSSTTALVRHDVDSVFDATPAGGAARRFEEDIGITLLSHETRLSGGTGRRSWVAGVSGVYDISRIERRLGDPQDPPSILGVRNENSEVALFGQYTQPLLGPVSITLGGRLTYARAVGMLIEQTDGDSGEAKRKKVRLSPTVAVSWRMGRGLLAFAHYQQGFRAGGLAVAPSGSPADSKRFEGDSLTVGEVGLRLGRPGRDRFSASTTLAYARWSDIQSDLVDLTGLPYTTNIGDGRVYSFEAQTMWEVVSGLNLEASVFLNDSALSRPVEAFAAAEERELPNIARAGARGALRYSIDLGAGTSLVLDGAVRYVGTSQLGIGAPFDVTQGDFVETSLGGRLALGRLGVSLDVSNLADVRGNRFSYGNPFGVAQRDQITPLRPRTVRVGLDARF